MLHADRLLDAQVTRCPSLIDFIHLIFFFTCRGTDSLKELCRSTALIQRLEQLLHDPEIPVQQVNIVKLFVYVYFSKDF